MTNEKINLNNFNFSEFQKAAIDKLKSGQSLTGKDGILTPLIKEILEAALDGEMDAHLSACKNQGQANRRNGNLKKTLKTGTGAFELETPRDREGSFEPEIVKKRQTVLNESLDNKVLSLYAIGMSYEAIASHLAELYGLEVSAAKISLITDKLIPLITEWRNRPLETVYPIVFLDAMHFKVREEGKVTSKAFYSVLGINTDGRKDILGLYLSENEGAHFWLSVLNDLRARGLEDILIASIKSWQANWEALSQYFKYPEALRRIIYTTNMVEGFHRQIRQYTKSKGAFTSENALLKLIYCACQKILEKWNQPMHNWALIVSQLQIFFDGRLNLGLK